MFHYAYFIRSIKYPKTVYVGYTTDLKQRIKTHNAGGSIHTRKDKPWKLVLCIAFEDKQKAIDFEQYSKTHAGRAFAGKRFW